MADLRQKELEVVGVELQAVLPAQVRSECRAVQLVQTGDTAVGRTTTFDVIQTFVGPRATAFEWEHGGTLHPINTMVEPNKLFVLFEIAPSASTWFCVPDGPFIRNIEGPPPSYATPVRPPPLLEIPGVEIASNRDVARALAASLPIHGAKAIGVDMPAGSNSSSESPGAGGASFGFHPAWISQGQSAEPMRPPVTSVAVTAALRIDGPRGRIVVSGSHSTPIGANEGLGIRALKIRSEPPKDREFQILAETDGGELTIVSAWFSQPDG